jgi:hypothetical protein
MDSRQTRSNSLDAVQLADTAMRDPKPALTFLGLRWNPADLLLNGQLALVNAAGQRVWNPEPKKKIKK